MHLDLSPNDRSIIGAICHYPDMKKIEKEGMIKKLHDRRLVNIVSALAGLKTLEELSTSERNQLIEMETWRNSKRDRLRNEEIHARRNSSEPSPFARKLLDLRSRGQVTEETLILYGVSGDLPVRRTYNQMTKQEQRRIWEERMIDRYGVTWREYFRTIPSIFEDDVREEIIDEWMKEGF